MRLSSRVPARLAAAALLFAAVLALRLWLSHGGRFPGDGYALAHYPTGGPHDALQQLEALFGALGSAPVAALTVIAATVAVARRCGARAALGVVLSVGVVLVVEALKAGWGPTPLWRALRPHHGTNYPSGHTAYATALFGYLALLAWRRRQPDLALYALALVVGMGPALVLGGAHLPSDVVGGYALGAAWLSLVSLCLDREARAQGAKNGVET